MKEESKEQKEEEGKDQQKEEEDKKKWAKKKYKFEELVKQWDYSLVSKLKNGRVQIAKLKDGNYIILFKTLINNIDKDRKKRIQIIWVPVTKESLETLFDLYLKIASKERVVISEEKETIKGIEKNVIAYAEVGDKKEKEPSMVRIKYTMNEEKEEGK